MADIKTKDIEDIGENKKHHPQSEVLIVIPAYNEAENIERVVEEIKNYYRELEYVVVTDGPTDGTDQICKNRGYNMIELPENMGLSKCFRTGMMYALESGYKYAVQLDGDGQHRPEYILSMKNKADEGYDIVMGSRFLREKDKKRATGSQMSFIRRLGSFMIRWLILIKTGVLLTDPTCGMRLYDRKIMEMFALHEGLSPEPDTMALLIKHGARVAEVPVKVIERTAGNSYLSPIKAIKYMQETLAAIMKVK